MDHYFFGGGGGGMKNKFVTGILKVCICTNNFFKSVSYNKQELSCLQTISFGLFLSANYILALTFSVPTPPEK